MPAPIKFKSLVIEAQKNQIRNSKTPIERLPKALEQLGRQAASQISEYILSTSATKNITTPVGAAFEGLLPTDQKTLVVTTKEDYPFLGSSIAHGLDAQHVGYIHIEGRRGLQALVAPIREMRFPKNIGSLDLLVVAKSVIATGCTASTLVRSAIKRLQPAQVVITALFYSERGLAELSDVLPNAQTIVLGDPDRLTSDGLLQPGLGILEDRLGPILDQAPLFAEGRVPPLVQLEPASEVAEAIEQSVVNICEELQSEGNHIAPADCIYLIKYYKSTLVAAQSEKVAASAMDIAEAITAEDVNAVLAKYNSCLAFIQNHVRDVYSLRTAFATLPGNRVLHSIPMLLNTGAKCGFCIRIERTYFCKT